MYAIKGVYDGEAVKFADPVPVKEKYDVLITFLNPVSDSGRDKSDTKLTSLNRLVGLTANNPVDIADARADRLARQ